MNLLNKKIYRDMKRALVTISLMIFMSLSLTGCQKLKETFGKEYRMIDNAFEQLEADVVFTLEEYAKEQNFTEEEWNERKLYLDQTVAELGVRKAELKNWLRQQQVLEKEIGTSVDLEEYIEGALVQFRVNINEQLKEVSNGTIVLKSTKVKRGLVGSIWYLFRNNWLITLIGLGVLGSIWEKIEEKYNL